MALPPDSALYLVVKHSWKGKYKRLLSIGPEYITTHNPTTMEVTNQWLYREIVNITPILKSSQNQGVNEFQLSMNKKNKVDHMKFSSEHRLQIMTKVLGHRSAFSQDIRDNLKSGAQKVCGHDGSRRVPVNLEVTPRGIDQLHPSSGAVISSYNFCDIESLLPVSDIPGGIAIKNKSFGRLHIFSAERRDEIFSKSEDNCKKYLGHVLSVVKHSSTLIEALVGRMGEYSDDIHQTSLCEFQVQKVVLSCRHPHSTALMSYDGGHTQGSGANYITGLGDDCRLVKRKLCLTESCLVERDPNTYGLVTLRPLVNIYALVRCQQNPQRLEVEWVTGETRVYICAERDALLASLMDGSRGGGNLGVHVKMNPSDPCKRIGPLDVLPDEDAESACVHLLQQPTVHCGFTEAIDRFNATVPYSGIRHAVSSEGLFAENKERIIKACISIIIIKGDDVAGGATNGSLGTPTSNTSSPSNGSQSSLSNSSPSMGSTTYNPEEMQAQFHALRRLVASKAGFSALTSLPGFREKVGLKVVKALQRHDAGVTHAAIDFLCALLQPMHDNPDLKQEQLNKTSLLHSQKFQEKLMETFVMHVQMGTGGLVIAAMLDFLTFAVCAPYSETTDGAHFDYLLKLLSNNGRVLYQLFQHPSLAIVKGAGLVLKAIIEEGDGDIPTRMQQLALTEGALLAHLYTGFFTPLSSDGRLASQRQLSRHLVALWCTSHDSANELLQRVLPLGLLTALESKETVSLEEVDHLNPRDNLAIAAAAEEAANKQGSAVLKAMGKAVKTTSKKVEQLVEKHMDKIETVEKTFQPATKQIEKYYEQYLEKHVDFAVQHWKSRMIREKTTEEKFRERPLVLRKRREHLKSSANWPLFYYRFNRDHALPNLIWNHGTREELRVALEKELREFREGREVRSTGLIVCWNHAEFEVRYDSLAEEIKVSDYYLRILLEQEGIAQAPEDSPIHKSYAFFNDLYHRFLLTPRVAMKCMCLQAMALVYGLHHEEIGQFNDTKYMVTMLSLSKDRLERDRLLLFINKLILERSNAREVIEAGGVAVMVDLMSLAHLHTQRALIPAVTSNAIEGGVGPREGEKEWYYQDSTKQQAGPYSFSELKELYTDGVIVSKTLVWSQGMTGWKTVQAVCQLKWTMVATGQGVLSESELAELCLSMLITMCKYFPSRTDDNCVIRPLARVKKYLSDMVILPTVVQLLVTFHPPIVEKVASLLTEVLQDNPSLSTLYTTGLFFFVLMYMGSNVLPIARLLNLSHLKQTFKPEEQLTGGDLMQQSILGAILPEAMVCYLHNYGPEKFAEIFLGEFDTPEVIWNREMRRYMIEKLASHLADFTPRLLSNVRVPYQYCPIPHITYPQLDSELFCDIFYLKHLCDTNKFPDWPIKDPVSLLKKVLHAWRSEVDKQPSSMSSNEAYTELGIDTSSGERPRDDAVRHAYLKLAQKYHPDKNPNGRARFESVKTAYEFLCSRSAQSGVSGPDPRNILLMISTQSILFHRYKDVLSPYKYAGYPMLLQTIELEGHDTNLFSKETSLLGASAELCYHTINCCALNAEQLCRERGLEKLQEAYTRCVGVLSSSVENTNTLAVEVCENTAKCFTAAAQFTQCRQRIIEMPAFCKNLCYTLHFKELSSLSLAGVDCVAALAIDEVLQMQLLQSGSLWHLLPRLFAFDYTLEEGGVTKEQSSNTQQLINTISVASLRACARLGGLYKNKTFNESDEEGGAEEVNEATPFNDAITAALQAMLTPYIVTQIGVKEPQEVLKMLTSNVETPYLVWDNSTRAQLMEFLQSNCTSHVKTGTCDPDYGAKFGYEAHKGHLVIGGVFIKVYNSQPMFPIEEPKKFCQDLLQFIGSECQYLHSLLSMTPSPTGDAGGSSPLPVNSRLTNIASALTALHNVCIANPGRSSKNANDDDDVPGVELQCVGHFKLLLSLLALEGSLGSLQDSISHVVEVQRSLLKLLAVVAANKDCVADIAASQVVVYLLLALHSKQLSEERTQCMVILHALITSTGVVKEVMRKGGVLYLLHILCDEAAPANIREKAAELLGAMTCDRLVGQRVRLLLLNHLLLPVCLVDQLRDSPPNSLHLYQTTQENPDLIWTDESRTNLKDSIHSMLSKLHALQRQDPNEDLVIAESAFDASKGTVGGEELVVGGVYLRLLQSNANWNLRKPKLFITELFDTLLRMCCSEQQGEDLELLMNTLVAVLSQQRHLLEYLPSLGHLPRVVELLGRSPAVVRAAVLTVHQTTFSTVCCSVLEASPVISGLIDSLRIRPDLVGLSVESLHNMFLNSSNANALHTQALQCGLVKELLSLLQSNSLRVANPSATKAQVVACIKTLAASPQYGQQVNSLLKDCEAWREYKDQKHDLFLDSTPLAGYLTGGTATAGYITQGNRTTAHTPTASSNPLPPELP